MTYGDHQIAAVRAGTDYAVGMAASDVPPAQGWSPPDAPQRPRVPQVPAPDLRPTSWGAPVPAAAAAARQHRIGATTWPGGDGTPPPGRMPAGPSPASYAYAPASSRPRYREALKATPAGIWAGTGLAFLWFLITGLLATTLSGYVWVTVVAALVAWLAALLLARYGDRGAAAGVAAVSGMALGVAGLVVEWHALGGEWILW